MQTPPAEAASPDMIESPDRLYYQRRRTEGWLAWLVGVLSFGVYFLTLCPAVYPGVSAQAVATVLNLLPQEPVSHPIWRIAAEAAARLPFREVPFRLNLFSALCGAFCVALLFRLASRVLFELIHNEPLMYDSAYASDEADEDQASASSGSADTLSAMIGGLLTAFAFAFGAPFWSASASLHPQTFDLLLFLLMATCLARYVYTGSILSLIGCVFLLCLGVVESALFLAVLPVVLFFLFRAGRTFDHISESFTLLFFVAGLLGLGAGLAVLISVAGAGHGLSLSRLLTLIMGIAHSHQTDLLQGLPHMGWLLVLLQTIIPLAAVFWGAPKFLASHEPLTRWLWGMLNVIFTFVAAACLLGLSYTPWAFARQGSNTPVIPGLATAFTLGILYVYWCLARNTPLLTYESEDYYTPPSRSQKLLSLCMNLFIVFVVLAAPFRNADDADGRKGAFADAVARVLVAQTGEARCLLTDGTLDWHLLIQAHLQKRRLTLVQANSGAGLKSHGELAQTAAATGGKRKGPPKKETSGEFIERWLRTNPRAYGQVAIMAKPDLWSRAGLCAVPNGLIYTGTTDRRKVNGPALLKAHEALWLSLAPLLSQPCSRPPSLGALWADLNRHASRVANDLGNFLEDLGCPNEADRAYAHALDIDADNLCAAFNRYGLWLRDPSRGNLATQESLIRSVSARLDRGFLFESCILRYGNLHSQPAELLDLHNATTEHPLIIQWIAYCRNQLATGARLLAATDSAPENNAALVQVVHAIRAGDTASAEKLLRTFLGTHPANLAGWSILTDLLLASGRTEEVSSRVLPAMRAAAGEKGDELVDMAEGLFALHQSPPRARDAHTFFVRALAHRPTLKEAQALLLKADRLLGDAALIETDALAILKTDANHSEANAILGSVRLSEKRYDEAEKHLRKSVATVPTTGALNDLAELLRSRKRLDEAEKTVRHALRLDPNFYQAWDTLGTVLVDQNRLSEADSAFRKALTLCAKDPRLHLNLARLNIKLNRAVEARQMLTQVAPMVAGAPASVSNDFDSLSRQLDQLTASR